MGNKMRISAYSALALGLGSLLLVAQLSACSNSAGDCNATASCGAASGTGTTAGSSGKAGGGSANGGSSDGGSDGAGTSNTGGTSGSGTGGEGGSSACKGDVADDAACWTSNDYGVFVSSEHGSDMTGDGTKEAPYATLSKGIGAAAGKKVYACLGPSGDYGDALSLDKVDGLAVYGGFDCETWEYSKTRKATVKSTSKIALRISTSKNIVFENLRFMAADATGTGFDASSYGAFVTDSKGVVFRRVEIKAGKGNKGADGDPGTKGENGAEPGEEQNGSPGLCASPPSGDGGVWPATPMCGGTRGGDGGKGVLNADGGPGFSGIPATNVTPPNVKNFGAGATTPDDDGVTGDKGSPGNAGTPGAASAALGVFNTTGYQGAHGKPGTDGFPGQGGGGGGASQGHDGCRGASGGAGGMGGCGGTAGKGGLGGGASVGLLSWSSELTLESCTISSVAGGAGGKGGDGGGPGIGSAGGSGGNSDQGGKVAAGGGGGHGANGGMGGPGSGGTGGPSYALVFSGTKPGASDDTTWTPGTGGAAGPGGAGKEMAPSGTAGASAPELEVP